MFENGLVIFVRNEGTICVILAHFISCRAIGNATSLKFENLAILTL